MLIRWVEVVRVMSSFFLRVWESVMARLVQFAEEKMEDGSKFKFTVFGGWRGLVWAASVCCDSMFWAHEGCSSMCSRVDDSD